MIPVRRRGRLSPEGNGPGARPRPHRGAAGTGRPRAGPAPAHDPGPAPDEALDARLPVALFTLAMPFVHAVGAWIVLRTAAGVASAWVLVHVSAWTLERLALARPELSGVVYAGVGAGSALAGLVCLGVLKLRLGADAAWIALGVSALLATVLIWPLFTDRRRGGIRRAV